MFMHVFIQIKNRMSNDQESLLRIFSPEEESSIIEFIYIRIPPQMDEIAMGRTPQCACQSVYV